MKLKTAIATILPLQACGVMLSDLPWDNLQGMLSPNATLLDTNPSDYIDQCYPEFQKDRPDRTHHNLVDQPSGLCMNALYCGFERCNPLAHETDMTAVERMTTLAPNGVVGEPPNSDQDLQEWLDPINPSYGLPPKVLFPKVAGDVVAAIEFAMEHKIEISIKNSGHSYTGASTKKDTLHINMNQYIQYAPTGILECSDLGQDIDVGQDLSGQPCKLALARGKPAVLRVSGGENFDKVYRAVKAYNEAQESYKYHLVGGAAGTVSPMGWTWQGGLSGTTAGRMFGFGVDQVLQIDMVLPNALHVRFGPTGWEDADGYDYPRTTEVTGVCNTNPSEEDESKWVWEPCSDDINFDDLWFAVRGGSGGTFGVVTSTQLQLHEYLPLEVLNLSAETLGSCGIPIENSTYRDAFYGAWWKFVIDFLLNPSSIGVSEEESNRCGAPGDSVLAICCFGEGAGDILYAAWKNYFIGLNQTLADMGFPYSDINLLAECSNDVLRFNFNDYAESILGSDGKAMDSPKPSYASGQESSINILLPKAWMLENRDLVVDFALQGATLYLAFGGRTSTAQDQSNALSQAHREAGAMLIVLQTVIQWNLVSQMYDMEGEDFPGFVGSNHAGPLTRGPLKSDWSKPCPLDWTEEERDENCISLQEAIWGGERLARLEAIKEAIDPDFMFDCYGCIGNNRQIEEQSLPPSSPPPSSLPPSSPPPSSPPPSSPSPSSSSLPGWKTGVGLAAAVVAVMLLS